ncbi:putative low-complexity protein [Leptolyngbya sp. PCC 7375]|nr:putative low-complexity protein [Leptolyngbya sp. PCC 7375]
MVQDYSASNLSGRNFRGQNLANADFSKSNLRGTDFSNAILIGASFKDANVGLPYLWKAVFSFLTVFLALVAGTLIGFSAVYFVDVLLASRDLEELIVSAIVPSLALGLFIFITLTRGIGITLGLTSIFIAVVIVIGIAVVSHGTKAEGLMTLIVLQAVAIAGIGAGVLLTAIASAVGSAAVGQLSSTISILTPVSIGSFLGCFAGIQGIPEDELGNILLIVIPLILVLFALGGYISYQTTNVKLPKKDKRFSILKKISIAVVSARGTKFRGANLTEADFSQALLTNADFRRATLTRTCWLGAKGIHLARVEGTYLNHPVIRRLVISRKGQGQIFDGLDLTGLNLQNALLIDASFIGTKLNETNCQGADLSRSKLVQAQLYGTNLRSVCMTGAYIQDWAISTDTQFDDIKCEYVYMHLPTKDDPDPYRKPDDRRENFEDGDFTAFITPIVKVLDLYRQQNVDPRAIETTYKTIDLFHHDGIDPSAAALALQQLAEQYPEAGIEVVSLEGRGNEKVRVQARVTDQANRSHLSMEYFDKYNELTSLSYSNLQSLLASSAEKDERIRSLESMLVTALNSEKFYVETYCNVGDTVAEKKSINIKAGGDVSNISGLVAGDVEGVLNLGTISGNVKNSINKLADSSKPNEPGLKELLQQLQNAIESEPELSDEDKVEALEQVEVLAETGQNPGDGGMKKLAKTAMKILKGTMAGLSGTAQLVQDCSNVLPAIAALLTLV